jgi:hypothetical protein
MNIRFSKNLTTVKLNATTFCTVATCCLVKTYVSKVFAASIIRANVLMREAAIISEKLINFHQITLCNIPVDSHLKSHTVKLTLSRPGIVGSNPIRGRNICLRVSLFYIGGGLEGVVSPSMGILPQHY